MITTGINNILAFYDKAISTINIRKGWKLQGKIRVLFTQNYNLIHTDYKAVLVFSNIEIARQYSENVLIDLFDEVIINSETIEVNGILISFYWIDVSDYKDIIENFFV